MYEAPKILLFKDHHGEGAEHKAASKHDGAQLPRNFSLAAPREHPLHGAQDVEARDQVEGLEDDVPCWVRLPGVEQVEVARAEDDRVESLRDQRNTLCGAVAVDGEDQDQLREDVGDVSQVAEEL